MEKETITVNISPDSFISCPYCQEHINLYEIKPNNEEFFSVVELIKDNKKYSFTCPNCLKEFIVNDYEVI